MSKFSVIYRPTTLFSLRDSNATSSGAKSLLLPSPYSIKMAIISKAISFDGVDFNCDRELFGFIRDAKISYHIQGDYCVNKCCVKIQKKRGNDPFIPSIAFREYVFMNSDIEVIFEVDSENAKEFLMRYLHTINYFGKRGCFFQFIEYKHDPSKPNVCEFNVNNCLTSGILQEYDDFNDSFSFDSVNIYSSVKTIVRNRQILVLPVTNTGASKSYSCYEVVE